LRSISSASPAARRSTARSPTGGVASRRCISASCLFSASSVGLALARDVSALIALRFLQALEGCAPLVVPPAVVRDYFDQRGSVRMLSVLMLVMGLAPILAPLIGGQLLVSFGWRSVFWLLAVYGRSGWSSLRSFSPRACRRPAPAPANR
jgi:DHA1 family bicyclomycin/chloramphenicol resistance-like MFS transporter